MPFSFLNPWFWLGALAVAAPLWLHLRRRREKNLVRFSAVRFLHDQPEPRRSPLRLRDLVLFALRVLALLCLVAAFTWPYLRGVDTLPVKESRVYILDNTLSHQANGGFERDRTRLVSELRTAEPTLQLAVIELTSRPRVVVAFGDDRQTARQQLLDLQPSFQRGSYLAAFRQANSMLANSLGERKHIVLLGDNQENQWNENVNTPAFLRNVQVDLPKAPAAALPNLSLSEPRAQRIFLGDKSLVHFSVKLTHGGPATTATVILRANGQLISSRPVDLENQPETILLQGQWEAAPGSWLLGEAAVEGSPDALPGDNRVFFSLAPVVEGKVALLAQSPYLRLALSPEVMRGQWSARVLDPARLEAASSPDADVLCIESSYLQSAHARKLLRQYLDTGRGVLLLLNRLTPAIDSCLRDLGFEVQGTVRMPHNSAERFQFVFSNHPIFHPFLSPDYGNLMDIRVLQYARVKPTQAMPLVYAESGAGLFFQGTRPGGKMFVAAFGLDREHTSWPIHQTFIPFLDLALRAARAEDSTPTTFEPAEATVLQLPGSVAHEIVLRQDRIEVARAPVLQSRAALRLPDSPGLYALTFDDREQVDKVFAVNPSPKESQLSYVDTPETLKNWQLAHGGAAGKAAVPSGPAQVRLEGVLQQRLWWWMVLGGLVMLTLETAIAETKKTHT
jgi:hypothetical protein